MRVVRTGSVSPQLFSHPVPPKHLRGFRTVSADTTRRISELIIYCPRLFKFPFVRPYNNSNNNTIITIRIRSAYPHSAFGSSCPDWSRRSWLSGFALKTNRILFHTQLYTHKAVFSIDVDYGCTTTVRAYRGQAPDL